jgi:hypothetical protein
MIHLIRTLFHFVLFASSLWDSFRFLYGAVGRSRLIGIVVPIALIRNS